MHKTIYIDIDEEITTILDKIRDEKSNEICIVVPKNAALTQGIINLKLLKKEVTKYGKTIVIATNDPQARKVIKRLEIKTQEIAEVDLTNDKQDKKKPVKKAVKKEKKEKEKVLEQEIKEEVQESADKVKVAKQEFASSDIGSETFFDGIVPENLLEDEIEGGERKQEPRLVESSELKEELYNKKNKEEMSEAREASEQEAFQKDDIVKDLKEMSDLKPENGLVSSVDKSIDMKRQTKTVKRVSSIQETEEVNPVLTTAAIPKGAKAVASRTVDFGIAPKTPNNNLNMENKVSARKKAINKIPSQNNFKVNDELNLRDFDEETSKKAEEFFGVESDEMKNGPAKEIVKEVKKVEKEVKRFSEKKGFFRRFGFAIFMVILFVGVGGAITWGYLNYPKAEITIYPRKKDFSKEIKVTIKDGVDKSRISEGIIPGQYKEMVIKKTMKFNATGETYSTDDGKAKGKVTIYNKYSEDEQPLVVTTRVLSKEGKLFRLAKAVTVPGMTADKPGTVEVAVIADKPGEDFNIGSSSFTIEGFKGKSKYTKFEVKSFEPMVDGGSPDSNKKLSMILAEDITRAKEKTAASLEKNLEDEVMAQLDSEMSAMFDSVEKEVIKASSTNDVKDVVKSFSYTIEQKVKLIAFATADVNSVALLGMNKEIDQDYEIEESQSKVIFKKSITDFENKTMTMYLDSTAVAWPEIEGTALAQKIADRKEEEIRTILTGYPTIEKIEFLVKPSWLTGLPIGKDKIDVKMVR